MILILSGLEVCVGLPALSRKLLTNSGRSVGDIEVQDSGPGLDPQLVNRLFDAFYTTKPQGLGMGLAISRSIIQAHGGRLWAEANAPQGAVFQFTLPLSPTARSMLGSSNLDG